MCLGERSALLGESCDGSTVFCEDARKQQCNSGTCTCKTGNRPVSEKEFYSLPVFTECVPDNFSIGNSLSIMYARI